MVFKLNTYKINDLYFGVNLCPFCSEEMKRYDFVRSMQRATRYVCPKCNSCYPVYYENADGQYADWRGCFP